jgi:hypothetical protein
LDAAQAFDALAAGAYADVRRSILRAAFADALLMDAENEVLEVPRTEEEWDGPGGRLFIDVLRRLAARARSGEKLPGRFALALARESGPGDVLDFALRRAGLGEDSSALRDLRRRGVLVDFTAGAAAARSRGLWTAAGSIPVRALRAFLGVDARSGLRILGQETHFDFAGVDRRDNPLTPLFELAKSLERDLAGLQAFLASA